MFNKGRPKKHVNIAYFTYEARDGSILSYEMNSKGPVKMLGKHFHQNLSLKPLEKSSTVNSQIEIQMSLPIELAGKSVSQKTTELQNFVERNSIQNPFTEVKNQQISCQNNFAQQSYTEEVNLNNSFSGNFDFENDFFDDGIYNNFFIQNEQKEIADYTNDVFGQFPDFQTDNNEDNFFF